MERMANVIGVILGILIAVVGLLVAFGVIPRGIGLIIFFTSFVVCVIVVSFLEPPKESFDDTIHKIAGAFKGFL